MFIRYRTQAVVIKKIDRGEADQLLIAYSKDFGRVEVVARGIRKIASKLRSAIEFVSIVEMEFIQGKTCKTLTDALIINSLGGSWKDLRKAGVLRQICDFAEKMVKDQQEDVRIWELLCLSLFFVESGDGKGCGAISHYFIWHLFGISGWRPELGEGSIGAQNLALVKFFCDADIEQSSLMRLTERQNDSLLAVAKNHLAIVTK